MEVDGLAAPTRSTQQHDMEDVDDLFAEPLNLEQRFYQEGYQDGFDHGKLHGLFEGRALGQEECFKLWEEVAYMEGWAETYMESLQSRPGSLGRREEKALNHARQLLKLVASFPTTNPTPTTEPIAPQAASSSADTDLADTMDAEDDNSGSATPNPADEQDLAALLSSIRARFKLLCTSLGARPRLMAAPSPVSGADAEGGANVVEGIEGPMKGVDTRMLRF